MFGKLSIVMGVTWILGFTIDSSKKMRYLYVSINSLQGRLYHVSCQCFTLKCEQKWDYLLSSIPVMALKVVSECISYREHFSYKNNKGYESINLEMLKPTQLIQHIESCISIFIP